MPAKELSANYSTALPAFPVGYHQFTAHPHLNYELNRCFNVVGQEKFEDIKQAGSHIHDFATYIDEMLLLARAAESASDLYRASMYYRNAEFFMEPADPRKQLTYEQFRTLFNQALPEVHKARFLVPYAHGSLPGWHLKPVGAVRGTLVVHGGFDSFLEEMYCFMAYLQDAGYEIYAFEGPGQGAALKDYNLRMTHEWEKPVKALLDHFNLRDVTLIGISLGGYFASRAAAFEPRITRLIAFDVLYDFFEAVANTQPWIARLALRSLIKLRARWIVNSFAALSAKRDFLADWGLTHGMYVVGVDSPFDFFDAVSKMTLEGIAPLIRQESYLVAGASDHMIAGWMLGRQQREMTQAAAVHTRIFTDAEHCGSHCQIGNIKLAMDWLLAQIDPK